METPIPTSLPREVATVPWQLVSRAPRASSSASIPRKGPAPATNRGPAPRGRTQIIASESAVPLYVVMAGAGLPSTSFLIPTLQVVDGGPAPVMTPRHECVATGDSIIPNEAK